MGSDHEQLQNARQIGLTRDIGWQIGVRRTIALSHQQAWELITSPGGLRAWLGDTVDGALAKGATYRLADGTTGEVRTFSPGSHLRLTWRPNEWSRPSTMQVRIIPSGENSVIAFHQEHLPDKATRIARREAFVEALDQLERLAQER